MAHARRKFHELWANHHSPLGEDALGFFRSLYDVEEFGRDLDAEQRRRLRQLRSQADRRHAAGVAGATAAASEPPGRPLPRRSTTAWVGGRALTRFLADGNVPIDNNWIENRIRPIALGRSNWLFAGSLRGGQRAAAAMSLIQSAKLNGHDPYQYLKDVLQRLPTHPASRIEELLPHRWQAPVTVH